MNRELRWYLTGGDRRSIADSKRVRAIVEQDPARVRELASLTDDEDWLVAQRAVDLLEKLAHDHPDWIEPYKKVFIAARRKRLAPVVERYLYEFETSSSAALRARARNIRARL